MRVRGRVRVRARARTKTCRGAGTPNPLTPDPQPLTGAHQLEHGAIAVVVLLDADRHVGIDREQRRAREAEVVDGLGRVRVRVGVRVGVRVRG